jgi:hypothetical protein
MVNINERVRYLLIISGAHGNHDNGITYRNQQTSETEDSNKLHDGRSVQRLPRQGCNFCV